jgi:UPF0755 protein
MMKRFIRLMIGSGIFFVLWYWHALLPLDADQRATRMITIERGMSVQSIASHLSEQGIVRSPFAFRILTWYRNASQHLRSGTYAFSPSLSPSEIIHILESGTQEEVTITIPEGLNVAEIDALLARKNIFPEGSFQSCAFECDFSAFSFLPDRRPYANTHIGANVEGYLFPETYTFNRLTLSPETMMKRMLREFEKRVLNNPSITAEMKRQQTPLFDVVTMASLIEKESRHQEERGIISGILWKRLANNVVLGVDASNRYEVGKRTEPLTKTDLEQRTPYNVRRVQGLPPSPITNAGLASIEAALRPIASSYWYYLHDARGTIHYAQNDDEHIANKRRYLGR